MLGTGLKKPEEALRFLREGIISNPNSAELYEELGTLYLRYLHNPEKGLECLEKALSLTHDSFERNKLSRLIKTVREMYSKSATLVIPARTCHSRESGNL